MDVNYLHYLCDAREAISTSCRLEGFTSNQRTVNVSILNCFTAGSVLTGLVVLLQGLSALVGSV